MTDPPPNTPTHFRAAARQPVHLLGALRANDALWNRDVRVLDLGLGGACVEAPDSVPAGTQIELVIEAPHLWDPLTLIGAVAWEHQVKGSEVSRLGVRFEHASGRSVRTLTELLEAEAFA